MRRIKIKLLNVLVRSLFRDAFRTNDHRFADKMLLLTDALREAGVYEE